MTPTTIVSTSRQAAGVPEPAAGGSTTTSRTAQDWAAVAAALNARLAACRLTQQRLADLSNISVATIRVLQRGTGTRRVRDDTLAAISRALGWPANHLLRVLLEGIAADQAHSAVPAGLDAKQHPRQPAAAGPRTAPGGGQHPLTRITTELDTASTAIDEARACLTHANQLDSAERDLAVAWLETATARLEQTRTLIVRVTTAVDTAATPGDDAGRG
ncbi:helix-turn-helix transcriptional regulator [Frankia sp. CNm7]|uniref:Helix-turn-helix transcriptional regulator n=1 Tax=Frankia nepalensis TaxID=1836974 RepID=A0A937RGV2_9ACTN|nr:helix-turn-helix transcriptional regulator [Frankia nepalensis]MBL7498298.1 helix-turn-helix transcriptional regulator [Frankia nepalensis]MBL7509110.1 helix-turn-helix transcriptional regulator [Frankia nepalensis]MBL7520797.1 helix-turn-helix transcriptional regulator [Frankia nepalensis]MBL7630155.1 helix-turn-helix transcriptional regulator [Frankia nepalensis]